jgi:hypothetical protein
VRWRNPHAELKLELPATGLMLPADLATRRLPTQSARVDGAALLKAAQLPTRKDRMWQIKLAPLVRMGAWRVPKIKNGDALAVLGFTFPGEKGAAILRVEYLFAGGKAYGLRSSPAGRRLDAGLNIAQSVAKASRAAAMVVAMSAGVCAALTKPASYSAGARYTPRSSMAWKKRLKRAESVLITVA